MPLCTLFGCPVIDELASLEKEDECNAAQRLASQVPHESDPTNQKTEARKAEEEEVPASTLCSGCFCLYLYYTQLGLFCITYPYTLIQNRSLKLYRCILDLG